MLASIKLPVPKSENPTLRAIPTPGMAHINALNKNKMALPLQLCDMAIFAPAPRNCQAPPSDKQYTPGFSDDNSDIHQRPPLDTHSVSHPSNGNSASKLNHNSIDSPTPIKNRRCCPLIDCQCCWRLKFTDPNIGLT